MLLPEACGHPAQPMLMLSVACLGRSWLPTCTSVYHGKGNDTGHVVALGCCLGVVSQWEGAGQRTRLL